MGIDLITAVLEETNPALVSSSPELSRQIDVIEEHLRSMRNVNAFMLMNINRCMDYTKATNGLKLVPHIETAPLIETIALPLHVMNAMQGDKARIELLPVPMEICSHIITDKQWLQENLMCLLSNAVKYSHKGVISVSLSLTEHDICTDLSIAAQSATKPLSPRWSGALRYKDSSPSSSFLTSFRVLRSFWSSASWDRKYNPSSSAAAEDEEREEFATVELHNRADQHAVESPTSPLSLSSKRSDDITPINISLSSDNSIKASMVFLRVEIQDTGIGLSCDAMQSLFRSLVQ
jgi:signal transduction histidine kinase